MTIELELWSYLLKKFVMTIETNDHWTIWLVMVLFQNYQQNGSIKTNGCHAKFKCKIWMDNYKYVTNLTCSQMWTILCILFSFILKLKGTVKETYDKVFFICIMSQYPYPWHFYQTPSYLDLYSFIEKKVKECRCKVPSRG
jgi:hypothetical protein